MHFQLIGFDRGSATNRIKRYQNVQKTKRCCDTA